MRSQESYKGMIIVVLYFKRIFDYKRNIFMYIFKEEKALLFFNEKFIWIKMFK